jgi:hypothetical protein
MVSKEIRAIYGLMLLNGRGHCISDKEANIVIDNVIIRRNEPFMILNFKNVAELIVEELIKYQGC